MKLALIGAIGNPNTGDEAICETWIQNYQNIFENDCTLYVFTKKSSYTSLINRHPHMDIIPIDMLHTAIQSLEPTREVYEYFINQTVERTNNSDYDPFSYFMHNIVNEVDGIHIIGGGYINSFWPDMLYEILLLIRLAKLYKKRIILTGQTIGPIIEDEYDWVIREIIESCDLLDLRDEANLEFVRQCQISQLHISVDDATSLKSCAEIPDTININLNNYLNINLLEWDKNTDLIENACMNVFVPFIDSLPYTHDIDAVNYLSFSPTDRKFGEYIQQNLSNPDYINIIDLYLLKPELAKSFVMNAVANIGMRFHMAVFSMSAAVPIFSMYSSQYYFNKISGVHKEYGSQNYCDITILNLKILQAFMSNIKASSKLLKTTLKTTITPAYFQKILLVATTLCSNQTKAKMLVSHVQHNIICQIQNHSKGPHPMLKNTAMTSNHNHDISPKVSVIIPIYNMEKYLKECLESVISQSLKEIEIICVNDGSTDRTQEILHEYQYRDSRITVINQENSGVSGARNHGLKIATGEYLAFIDPDDYYPDNQVLYDLYTAAINNQVNICGGEFREDSPYGSITRWEGNQCKYNFPVNGIIEYQDYQFDYGWTRFIYNRDFIINNGFQFPNYKFFEDPVFFVQVMHTAQKFFALSRCTYCYRTGFKTLSWSYPKVIDLCKGLRDNMLLAKENGYEDLLALEKERMLYDYRDAIVEYIAGNNNEELRSILFDIDNILFTGNNRIEFLIYEAKMIDMRGTLSAQEYQEYHECLKYKRYYEEIRSCSAFKLGKFLLYIPSKIKRFIKRRR